MRRRERERARERVRGRERGAGVKCRGTHFYDKALGGVVLQ